MPKMLLQIDSLTLLNTTLIFHDNLPSTPYFHLLDRAFDIIYAFTNRVIGEIATPVESFIENQEHLIRVNKLKEEEF